ncbi:hypothetical protein FRC09_013314 [Ceratobasidium sp. 395]|nr:hypothetical protein FRC09_013314 [Ceratobasidium sp. 395]
MKMLLDDLHVSQRRVRALIVPEIDALAIITHDVSRTRMGSCEVESVATTRLR